MNNNWYSFSVTDVGKKRSVNQDSIYSDDIQNIWVVADGMGGHKDGDKASQAIVKIFKDTEFSIKMSDRVLQIEKSMRALNTELQHYSSSNLNGQLMGSTIIVFTVCQGICAAIWAGDSRCYKINNKKITQVSWDHSYVDELLRSGHMVAEEAATSKLSNVITRAVGAHADLYFDHVIMPYSDDDTFLLCSDGLTNELSDKTINHCIGKHGCTQESIDILLEKTLEHGARDNISIILVSCQQRRPFNLQESLLLRNYGSKLNSLANLLVNKELELPSYYQQIIEIINQSISSHSSFTGKETLEFPVIKEKSETQDVSTAKFPQVTQPKIVKNQLKVNYILLLSVIAALCLALFFLVLG